MTWKLVYTKKAQKDAKKLLSSGLKGKAQKIIEIIKVNPYQKLPLYEKLIGDLVGAYSRRINIQRRVVYQVHEEEKVIKIIRLWTHYS